MDSYPFAQLGPLAEVAALAEAAARPLAFRARTRDEANVWRHALRERLAQSLRIPGDARPPTAEIITSLQEIGYSHRLVLLRGEVGGVPVHVLRPDGPGPFRAVLAVHGHGPGVRDVLGTTDDARDRGQTDDAHTDFARSLVRRGFLVFAPEQLGFGERRDVEDIALGSMATSCRQASLALLLLGYTMAGLRVRDLLRVLDYAETYPDAARGGVGGVGFSSGGTSLLYTAALDERVTALVLSGCVASYRQSIAVIAHCEDAYVPGILAHAELADILASLAPRSVFVESGMDDDLFPASASVATIAQVRKAYLVQGAADRLESEVFAGGHRFHGGRSLDWLARRL